MRDSIVVLPFIFLILAGMVVFCFSSQHNIPHTTSSGWVLGSPYYMGLCEFLLHSRYTITYSTWASHRERERSFEGCVSGLFCLVYLAAVPIG
ncbi:hypothetical protein F4810DRAFT_175466 [Camillea tinctor]|nr:hypothetical protein F4810DRAFT_175466 [Camillea tinctor]